MEIAMFGDFYSSNETTIIGEFENIKELNQSLICDPSELKEQVLSLNSELKEKLGQLELSDNAELYNTSIEAENISSILRISQSNCIQISSNCYYNTVSHLLYNTFLEIKN